MDCMHAGMQGIWLDRRDDPWPSFDGTPYLQVDAMNELDDALSA